ncbi:MAG: AEC family transporter [Candidatus Omnitrophota bacterium]
MKLLFYFNSVSQVMLQIFILGLVGFALTRRKLLSPQGLTGLTTFLIGVSFPALIFWQVITKFSFSLYPQWWIFPLISLAITLLGLATGYFFSFSRRDIKYRREFISLVGFQNAGYMPLILLNRIVSNNQADTVLIYLFLFLLGFNLVIWSWGVYFLCGQKRKDFSLGSLPRPFLGKLSVIFEKGRGLFSPPVIAVLLGFLLVALKINPLIPGFVLEPLKMLGNCSFPLAVVVVGASLAELCLPAKLWDKRIIFKLILAKLIVLPFLGLLLIRGLRPPYLIGLLVILELAVPSANSLVVISRRYCPEDKIISQGIFFSHIASLITIPLFLTLFNLIVL